MEWENRAPRTLVEPYPKFGALDEVGISIYLYLAERAGCRIGIKEAGRIVWRDGDSTSITDLSEDIIPHCPLLEEVQGN